MLQIAVKMFLLLQKLKILFCGHILSVIVKSKNLFVYKKELTKANKKEFE